MYRHQNSSGFVALIGLLICKIQDLGKLSLFQIVIFTQISHSFIVMFHKNSPFILLMYTNYNILHICSLDKTTNK